MNTLTIAYKDGTYITLELGEPEQSIVKSNILNLDTNAIVSKNEKVLDIPVIEITVVTIPALFSKIMELLPFGINEMHNDSTIASMIPLEDLHLIEGVTSLEELVNKIPSITCVIVQKQDLVAKILRSDYGVEEEIYTEENGVSPIFKTPQGLMNIVKNLPEEVQEITAEEIQLEEPLPDENL